MIKILITGANGFVGSNLFESFHSTCYLVGLDIYASDKFPEMYNWSQIKSLPTTHTIIHLAGKAHDIKNTSDSRSYFDVNVGLTQKIFDLFLESKAKKFIFFSSVKAVADSVTGEFLTEKDNAIPSTPYGRSKLEAESYILSKKLPAGKQVYILRPCMIHGPGNKGNLNLLYKIVKSGIPWPLGAFANERSFLSIDNLIFVIKNIIENDIPSGIYNVADDEPLSTNQLISLIAQAIGKKPKIWNLPQKLVKSTAKAGDFLHLPLNSERLKKLTESYVVSNNKIKKALSINKMPISATEGMRKTLKSFTSEP